MSRASRAPRQLLQALAYSAGTTFIYETWRARELEGIRRDCLALVRDGLVELESPVSAAQKQSAWERNLLPAMVAHWEKQAGPKFVYGESSTWPSPSPTNKCREMSSTNNKVSNLPRITSDNYRVQAICAFLIDPSLQRVHFGRATHWKLQLLANPLRLFFSSAGSDALELEGSDQSWHLVMLPTSAAQAKVGQPLPNAAHIDNGESGIFSRLGLPPRLPCEIDAPPEEAPLSAEERILLALLHQIAIIFYCETPGLLAAENGATGFYPGSHLALVEALRALKGDGTVSWEAHSKAVRALAVDEPPPLLLQPALPVDRQLLAFGLLVHTTMWAARAMNDGKDIRVVQNPKIKACTAVRSSSLAEQRRALAAVGPASLLRVVARGDADEWARELGLSGSELQRVQRMAAGYCASLLAESSKENR